MSPYVKRRRNGNLTPRRLRSLQLSMIVWLMVVWVALWGDVSAANVLAGLLIGAVVSFVFPLPPLRMHLRVRPLHLAWLVVHFLASLVVASFQVTVATLRFDRTPRNAVIGVTLRTESDFVLTVVAEMTSLVPGSIVVEARRFTHTLFLHVLDVGDVTGAEQMRDRTYALERRVVRAFGAELGHLDHVALETSGGGPT